MMSENVKGEKVNDAVIIFDNVTKKFGDKAVLNGVSFTIEKGEILAVVGPSGTGKSVTLKHIVGLLEPDSGHVFSKSEHTGYLFQSGALLAWMTVAENVALPLRETTDLKDVEIDRKVAEALAAVELTDAADKYPSEISGGMQKRAGLARAIVRKVDTVLYDEPTSGLDPVTSVKIHNLIVRLNKERGITSVVVTHDLQGALKIANRILLLKDGKAVACATPEEFVKSDEPEVQAFLAAMKGEEI